MLSEDPNACAICTTRLHSSHYYCSDCYKTYRTEIYAMPKPEWLRAMWQLEAQRRRTRNKNHRRGWLVKLLPLEALYYAKN